MRARFPSAKKGRTFLHKKYAPQKKWLYHHAQKIHRLKKEGGLFRAKNTPSEKSGRVIPRKKYTI
ncbi:MAG: hypothetical protein MJZ25_06265 [Fibrobacter sp.]|nr:hypothetical protein [Fibrobacter sp.]